MQTRSLFLLFIVVLLAGCTKELKGPEILERSIAYHDPNNQWPRFQGTLNITMSVPDQPDRISEVNIDLPENKFNLKATRDSITTYRTWDNGKCTFSLNGESDLTPEQVEAHRGTCERTTMMKNYYTYLYGLPMKLRDPGSRVAESVERKEFMGREYLAIKVTYDPEVGEDIWYFYINPETYAMEAYQFFKDEAAGKGEYILLEEISEIQGMRIPKNRAWYTNQGEYLGTDILVTAE